MATAHQVPVEFREDSGKGASRRLRRSEMVPAILYGGDLPPRSLQMTQKLASLYSTKEWFYTSVLELTVGDDVQRAVLRDIQRHPYKKRVMHLDFQRISDTETLRLRVPLHFLNQSTSPAGKTGGCVILHELNDVEIECLPKDLPEYIEVDLAKLEVGSVVHLSEIVLPAGVIIPELNLGKEHDVSVVSAKMAAVEKEEGEEGEDEGED
ncbi:MAG: 50S ribosomal protein L25/general stress protein Ctc [Xanthomonadales bacterium]|nr:50S ribosomal protein L25/general stress protein Ctc [Xanthomonadales bacterium]